MSHEESVPANGDALSATGPCDLEAERLAAFLDGRLSDADADAVVSHLIGCELCRWIAGRVTLLAM